LSELFNISNDEEISAFAKQYMNYLAFKTKNFEPLLFNDPHFIAYNPENGITSTSTLISKASDYASAGQYGKAYGLLKLALERNTSDTLRREIVRRLVNLDLSQGNTSRALKDISLLPKNSQEDKDLANYLLFKTYLKAGKLVDAYEAARKVSSLENVPEEERSSFLAKLARYYKLTGKGEEALKLIRELIKSGNLSQVDYDDLVSLALLAQQKGELPLAQRLIVEAVKKAKTKTQKAESLFFKASIEAQLGRVDEAILDYLKIAYEYKGLEPWSSTSLYNAAQLFEEKGKYEEALKLYKKVAELKRGTKEGEVAAKKVKSLLQKIGEEE
jgi:tetratricopeptide (TPR) repeat protein